MPGWRRPLPCPLIPDPMNIPELRTERLLLRPFREADLDKLSEINAHPEVAPFVGDGRVPTRADTWRQIAFFLGHWELRGYGMWAVELVETEELIGRVGYLDPEGWPGFELAWTLARPRWGRGYATEAASAALQYAFDVLGREQVISLIRPNNHRSIALAERIGETRLGETELLGGPVLIYGVERPVYDA
jgi:RimJ/RimL family protein N-acetyltransferase